MLISFQLKFIFYPIIFEDPKRKVLVTGSIPSENLPQRPHEVPAKIRRTLVRNVVATKKEMPSTSSEFMSDSPIECPSIEDFQSQLENEVFLPWTVDKSSEGVVNFQLHDGATVFQNTL